MQIIIRKFNEYGIKEFETLLANFRDAKEIDEEDLNKLIFNDHFTSLFDEAEPLELEEENNKYSIAKIISESIKLDKSRELDKDKGLWTWLSALILKRLVKSNVKTGELKLSEDNSLYIYDTAHNRYYRHLIAFPCLIYSSIGEIGKEMFLRGTIDERGEVVEQLSAVQDIQRNPGVVEAATILYYDKLNNDVKRGAASKENEKKNLGGQVRRFRVLLKQFALTYDLNAMNGSQIVDLLPREFDRWKNLHISSDSISII